MATLIQSKQIEGIVTASVIRGDFQVDSGSVNLTGASGVSGSFSGSFIGDGSGLTNIPYSNITGTPIFKGGSNTTIASSSNIITISSTGGGGGSTDISHLNTFTASYYTDSASFDTRISGISASGSGADWNVNLQNIPSGLVSGSVLRTLDGTGVLSGSITNYLPSGTVSGSSQITFSGLSGKPSGLVSSSTQITDGSGILSGSIVDQLPSGIISGSTFTSFSSSVDSRLDTLENATDNTGSDTQSLSISGDQLTISDGNTVTIPTGSGTVPAGTISGSAQITAFGFTSGSHTDIPSGTVSGSSQLTSSYDSRYLQTSTYTTDSASFDTRISNIGDHANISHLNAFTQSAGVRLDSIESFTSSIDTTIKTKLNTEDVLSGSIESLLPSGVISGSTQITDGSGIVSGSVLRTLDGTGVVSGSVLRTLDSTGVFSGSLVAGTNITINQVGDNFEISSSASGGSASVTVSDSAPGSPSQGDLWWKSDDGNLYIYYDGYWVISTDITTGLPAGVVSGSAQITSVITDTYISASAASSGFGSGGGTSDFTQLTNVPSGLVSGSSQLTSSYDTRYLNVNGDGVVSGSVLRTLDGTGVVSGSVLRTLDGTGVVSGSVLRTLDGTGVVSGSVLRTLDGTNVFSGSFIGQGGTTITSGSGNVIISSSASGDVTFNGNRIISQDKLPAFFTSSFNPGTSGSVQDFLNAVFYPNTEPSITTGNQTISEYSASNAQIVQLVATDPEGQSLTFGTASSYTDDLVRVSSGGIMTLNALAESSSFNTDSVSGGHGHLVKVTATDTFNSTVEKDIYIIVTPNEAPKFRETSVSGNIITSVTANLNESSANDTLVKRVFFTDTESDTITITTSSIDNNHFDVTVYGTYLDIRQNTGSLDYEQQTTYNFSITASDEHFENGQDSDSRTFLPITVNVTDNLVPVVNSQVVGSINENSSNGTSVGSISATDSEGDSISFVTFDLHKLLLDGVEVSSGSYGGTSQLTDPHENPFQMDSSGNVTRKTGVLLNSDLINSYQYRVQVRDNYNATISSASVATINVVDDTPATLTDNFSNLFIKESELSFYCGRF
jgi:hypothetical protein